MLSIIIPDGLPHTTRQTLNALTGYQVEITLRDCAEYDARGQSFTVQIAGFTPDGDLIARDVVDGFTSLGTSLFDVPTIRRVKVL